MLINAIKADNLYAVSEVIGALVESYEASSKPLLLRAIDWCAQKGNAGWIYDVWHLTEGLTALAQQMSGPEREGFLKALVPFPTVDTHLEWVLNPFGKADPQSVLDYFDARLRYTKKHEAGQPRYDAIPYSLTEMTSLEESPALVLGKVLEWMGESDIVHAHDASTFMHAVFPSITEGVAKVLTDAANSGEGENALDVLEVLLSYNGSAEVYDVCKEIVAAVPKVDDELLNRLGVTLNASGTVSGEFGLAEAYTEQKKRLEGWTTDPRPQVAQTAEKLIPGWQRMIASEHRRSEQREALGKLDWGEPLGGE